jgi:DNA-binding MarR family transcriptional regulator
MANKPSHGLQQRILAFVATRPSREIHKNGGVETCSGWISKRLDVNEKSVVAELEAMEREGLIRMTRNTIGNRNIKTVQVAHGVEPEDWAMTEMQGRATPEEPVAFQLPADLDYRKLADSMLVSAFEVLSSSSDLKTQAKTYEDEITTLREKNEQMRTDLSHVKVERDTNIRARKVAEDAAKEQKERADEALTQVAELQGDIEDLEHQVTRLKEQVRTAAMGQDIIDTLNPEARHNAGEALLRMLEEQRNK